MDAIDEYLIKKDDFPKILEALLKENVVDKIIGANLRVDKKTQKVDRFTVTPKERARSLRTCSERSVFG